VFWVISVYFNIRNTLPKFFTFPPGHPVYNDPTNALVCNKTLIKIAHTKTLKKSPQHVSIIIRELFDPG
jgi:hypothetical protein